MLEIGSKLKIFAPGEGTKTIMITGIISLPYSVQAKDNRDNLYTYINEYFWYGPGGILFYTLDGNNCIKDPKMSYLGKDQTEII